MIIPESTIKRVDFQHLPSPIRRYLEWAGVEGQRIPVGVEISCRGEFSMDHGKSYLPITSKQINMIEPVTRDYHIRARKGILCIRGRDSYLKGQGRMVIKLMGIFKVQDVAGPEMNQGALVTFLDDMVFVPHWWLDDRLSWEEIDQNQARVRIKHRGNQASIILIINEIGQAVTLVTEDRYQATKAGNRLVRWSTPVRDFREVDGVMVPTAGDAIWHEESGDFLYVKLSRIDIKYIYG